MLKKKLFRVATVFLSLLLIITMLSSCGLVNLFVNAILTMDTVFLDFNDLRYERPDFEEIEDAFVSLTQKIEKKKNSISVLRSASEAFELYNDAYTQYNLVQIRFYGNVNDTEAEEEINYCAKQFALLDPIVNDFYITALDNGYENTFFANWSDTQIEYIRIQKKMFDDEYAELVSRRTEIENEYMGLISNYTVPYNGANYTLEQIRDLDTLSESAYRALVGVYYNSLEADVAELYKELVNINDTLAEKAGFDTYTEFSYRYIYQRDYSPENVEDMYRYVKEEIVPLYYQVASLIDSKVLESAMTAENATFKQYDAIFKRYTSEISPTMNQAYKDMKKYHLYNIGASEGMQNAGLTTYLPSYGMPYIYLYTYGDLGDISSFIHEFGHFFGYYYNGEESDGIIDVAEIQSQANEWLFMPYYDLSDEQLEQFTLYRLSETLLTIIEGCMLDEFQQNVYQDIDKSSYKDLFESIAKSYRFDEIASPEILPNYWALVHHNFVMPLYYISYAVSALPSLEIYFVSQDDRETAISAYLSVINELGFREYLEVLDDADLNSPFDEVAYQELSKEIKQYLLTVK